MPRDRLPEWLQTLGSGVPLTHGIAAARNLGDSGRLLTLEVVIGCRYAAAGLLLLRLFEFEARRTASLETM